MRNTAERKNDSAPVLLEGGDGRVDVELREREPTTSDQKFLEFGIGREFEAHGPVLIPKLFGWNLASIAAAAAAAVLGWRADRDHGVVRDPGIFTASIYAQEDSLTAIFDIGKFACAAVRIRIHSAF